jgi:hypothetical protein
MASAAKANTLSNAALASSVAKYGGTLANSASIGLIGLKVPQAL